MFSILNSLARGFFSTKATRPARRTSRQAKPQLEGLEDRLVMTMASHFSLATTAGLATTANLTGTSSTQSSPVVQFNKANTSAANTALSVMIGSPNDNVMFQSNGAGLLDVYVYFASTYSLYQTPIATLRSVSVTLMNNDNVYINDSNGMPFASGTSVSFNGTGSAAVVLQGSVPVNGGEIYVAGGVASTPGTIFLANVTYTLHSNINQVFDDLPITGNFDVQTSGSGVQLATNSNNFEQSLFAMGVGGGDLLNFSNKPQVTLEEYAANASVFLDAMTAATGENNFTVRLHGAGDSATIDSTPNNVVTNVSTRVAPVANNATVAVWGDFAPVFVNGTPTTGVSIGYPLNSTGTITKGINANVSVVTAGYLVVNDMGNVTSAENVTVTDNSIYGTGLFGNNNAEITYGFVSTLDLIAGQMANTYTVEPSVSNAAFTSNITILSNSTYSFTVYVGVNSSSDLNLTLFNEQPKAATKLSVLANGGSLNFEGTHPNGVVDAIFAGLATSEISYNGFTNVV